MTHAWDDLGRRKSMEADIGATNDFKNSYKYDGLSRLRRVDQDKQGTGGGFNTVAEKRVDLVYDQIGRFTKLTRFSNVAGTTEIAHSDYEYDNGGRLIGLDHEKSTNALLTGYDWTYDNLDRVKSVDFLNATYNAEDAAYSYDATDQLIGADRLNTANDGKYVHDLNGNRKQSGTANWKTDTDNRLSRDGVYEYTYDKEGNRTKRVALDVNGVANGATTEYAFDQRNRLTTVTEKPTPGGGATKIVKYEYDAFDRRIAKSLDSDANGSSNRNEFYVWSGDDVIFDFVDADGVGAQPVALAKRYLWGEATDQILAEETIGGATVWHLADNLGSVRDLADNSGNLVSGSHVNYDAFGKPTGTPQSRFTFTAQEYDPDTGLYYYNARWYDPRTGTFLSQDSWGFAAGDENLLRMVGNSPTNYVDPSGHHGIPQPDGTLGPAPPPAVPAPPPTPSAPTTPSPTPEWVRLPNGELVMGVRQPGESQSEMYHRVHQEREDLNHAVRVFGYFRAQTHPELFAKWYAECWPQVRKEILERGRRNAKFPTMQAAPLPRQPVDPHKDAHDHLAKGNYVRWYLYIVLEADNFNTMAGCMASCAAAPASRPQIKQLARPAKGTAASGGQGSNIRENAAKGKASQKRVLSDRGQKENKSKFKTSKGDTVPDSMDGAVTDVKDVQKLSNDKQMQKQQELAKQLGMDHVVVTGKNTKVSKNLLKNGTTKIERRDDLGPQE